MRYRVLRNPRHCTSLYGMVDTIADLFHEATPPADYPLLTLDNSRFDELDYMRVNYPERLAKFRTLVTRISASDRAYDALYHLRYTKDRFSDENMVILHSYRELLVQHPNSASAILTLHSVLKEVHGVRPESDGSIPTLEAHLRAKQHYSKHVNYKTDTPEDKSSYEGRNYESNDVYVQAVQKHYDHVDALMGYREERGILITNGHDDFDPADFEEYIRHAVLADGWI